MSRRPRGSAASLLRELKYTIRVLAPCAHGTVAHRAIELAQEPPGPGVAATPPKGTRGSGEGSLPSRTRLPRAGRFATLPATGLRPGPSEGESGLPDGAVVPWLLDSCSAILTRKSETKKQTVSQQRSACAHRSRSERQLRPACQSSTMRARHRQCACATGNAHAQGGIELAPYAWCTCGVT